MSGETPRLRHVIQQFRRIGPLVLGLGTIAALSLATHGEHPGLPLLISSSPEVGGVLLTPPSSSIVATTTSPLPGPPRALFHEQTVAIVTFNGPNATMDDCELILAESSEQFDKEQLLKSLSQRMSLEQVSLATMISVVEHCKTLQVGPTEERNISENYAQTNPADDKKEMFKFFRGILPGTLWCGFDDVAPSYRSLGASWKLDRCCRAHDHCPVKVKPFQSRYGVRNLHPYTKVYCDCDDRFYSCLKEAGDEKANAVGNLFFNMIGVQCIQEERRPCDKWASNREASQEDDTDAVTHVTDGGGGLLAQLLARVARSPDALPPRERMFLTQKRRRACEVYGAGSATSATETFVTVPTKRKY